MQERHMICSNCGSNFTCIHHKCGTPIDVKSCICGKCVIIFRKERREGYTFFEPDSTEGICDIRYRIIEEL